MKSKPLIDLRINIANKTYRMCIGLDVTKESDTDTTNKLSKEDTYTELSRMEDSINEIQNSMDVSDNHNLSSAGNSRVLNKADIVEAEDSKGISVEDQKLNMERDLTLQELIEKESL